MISLIVLQSCNQDTSSMEQYLSGKWKWIGFYKNDHPSYDTIQTIIEDQFGTELSTIKNIYIWTDSGTYVHRYQNDQFIGMKLSTKSSITEFIFRNKQEGEVLDYEIDLSAVNDENPRNTASKQNFTIIGRSIVFIDSDLETKVIIEKITEDELVLKFADGKTSKFEKYGKEP